MFMACERSGDKCSSSGAVPKQRPAFLQVTCMIRNAQCTERCIKAAERRCTQYKSQQELQQTSHWCFCFEVYFGSSEKAE